MTFDTPTADEYKFVFDSWANSFRKSPWAGCVPNHLWDQVSREAARSILDRGARVIVAVTSIEGADGRRVMGYAVSEPGKNILHFLYVKADFRNMGVGRAILDATVEGFSDAPCVYTHRTNSSSRFLDSHPRPWKWDPVPARVK